MKIRKTTSEIMIKAIDTVGFASGLIGLAGLAGNIETGKSIIIPLLMIVSGALMMWATSLLEIVEDEKRNGHRVGDGSRSGARPYFLR